MGRGTKRGGERQPAHPRKAAGPLGAWALENPDLAWGAWFFVFAGAWDAADEVLAVAEAVPHTVKSASRESTTVFFLVIFIMFLFLNGWIRSGQETNVARCH